MPLIHFAFLGIGGPEIIIILGIIVLLFGSKKLPDFSKNVGSSIKELKKGISEATEIKEEIKTQATKTTQSLRGVRETPIKRREPNR